MTEPFLRAADTDRNQIAITLEREVGTGRLTLDEYSDRIAAAYRARTLGELAALTSDLPPSAPAPVPAHPGHKTFGPMVIGLSVLLAGLLVTFAGSPTAAAMTATMIPGMGCG
ncbi:MULTISPECIES: DUF1707 SHOCT-like domain-containing protein [Rhodococcus]|uniref:DUF1707 SHOCT-like domain-containing protein n=1 Tax=Rhodococcus TaxID=1827 RepID=UPI0013570EF0|nr:MULTISPECIES: DUF1707 domain-containing protein [Rhodococcus]